MSGYTIVDNQKIEPHITFIRINPTDVKLTLKEVFESLSDLCWISSFDKEYIQDAFQVRAQATVDYIADNIIKENADVVTSNSGEYVISELARKTIVREMSYLDIPLAELFKIKDAGNHGFDFYTINGSKILLFGEAKYVAGQNAYGRALKQIVKFENTKQDCSDIIDIDLFCCDESKTNFSNNKKGFVAAFSSKTTATKTLIENIKNNADFQTLKKFEEIICVAVNL
jgi:hypothetical protein